MLGLIHAEEENPDRKINAADETEIPAVPFNEAMQFLKSKVPMSKAEWLELEPKLRFRAFTVAQLGSAEVVDKAKQILLKSFEKGGGTYSDTWEELKKKVNVNALDIKPGYWENVFRTNTQSAYIAGKLQQYENSNVAAYQLMVIEDGRTSRFCRHLLTASGYGMIISVDHPFWKKYGFPPYHFQCRTSIRAIWPSQVGKLGNMVENPTMKSLSKFKVQEGFGGNPLDRGSWWEMTDNMKRLAEKFGIMEKIKEGEEIIFNSELQEIENLIPSLANEFVEAKNIKEANEYAEKVLGIPHADYKGVSLNVANEWNKGLYENFQKVPELRERFGFVGECHARNAAIKERFFELYREDIFDDFRKLNPNISDTILEPYVDKELNSLWRKFSKNIQIEKNTVALSLSTTKEPWNEFMGITINKDVVKDYAEFIEHLKLDVASKFHPEGTATIKGVFDHEIAHQLDAMLDLRKDSVILKLWNGLTENEITDGLSRYSWDNSSKEKIAEFIAEGWSEYCNNPSPRPIAKQIGDRIMEVYKTWKK